MIRNCLFCKYFNIEPGSPGYSEWTPGWDMRMECNKGIWSLDEDADSAASFRAKMWNAKDCQHFEYYATTEEKHGTIL